MSRRLGWIITLATFGAVCAIAIALLESPQVARQIELRAIEELERATGGKVTLEQFRFDWRRLAFHTGSVVLRGTEGSGEPPLFQAKSLNLDLSIRSLLRGAVRIDSLIVEEPLVYVIVREDGTTNVPQRGNGGSGIEKLIDMEVGRVELRNGEARVNETRVPVDVRAEGVRALVTFEPPQRRYRGSLDVKEILGGPLPAAFNGEFTLAAARLDLVSATIRTPHSSAEVSGHVQDWDSPRAELHANLKASLHEAASVAKIHAVRGGEVEGTLTATMDRGGNWMISAPLAAHGVHLAVGGEAFKDLRLRTKLMATPGQTYLDELRVDGLGGHAEGKVEILNLRRFRARGEIRDIEIPGDLSARVSGPVEAEGWLPNVEFASARLKLVPESGPVPVGGSVDAAFAGGELRLVKTRLELGGSEVILNGTMREGLAVGVRTRNLGDLLPAARLLSAEVPRELPISLEGQPAFFNGQIQGALEAPSVNGTLAAQKLRYQSPSQSQTFENVRVDFSGTRQHLEVRYGSFRHQGISANGKGSVALSNWRVTGESNFAGEATFQAASIGALLKEFKGPAVDLDGSASGKVMFSGTVEKPSAHGAARIEKVRVAGETFDFAQANFVASADRASLHDVEIGRGNERVRGRGEWKPGDASFEAATDAWSVEKYFPLGGPVSAGGSVRGRLRQSGDRWEIAELNGTVRAQSKTAGTAELKASSDGGFLQLDGQARLYGASLAAESRWRLEPGLPGSAKIRILSLTQSTVQQAAKTPNGSPLPFEMQVEGGATVEGQLMNPDRITGRATLSKIRFAPTQQNIPVGMTAADLTVQNDGPVLLSMSPRGIVIDKARFVAKDTEIEALGNVAYKRASQMNLLMRGRINLAVFSTFKPDLVSSGISTLSARVRGPLRAPDVDGRLAFENASFYLRDVPNGLDHVNGSILFDSSRASIESLTAESGGGTVALNGYIGFGAEISYQLQALLTEVRVRYPEGVSTQANASLTLSGSSRRSLLSGTITILRGGLTPATDVGGLLARPTSGGPVALPTNETLRGMRFDLRVETAQSAELSTQLTKDVEADVDLRIRGTPVRPVVLGRISITQGEVQFFGTDYKINRGEINFVNPVSVEPQVDLDLETRVRGITVSITFAGPLNKMNMTYRSDPPLQSSEILALLAVGRTPTSATQLGLGGVRANDLLGSGGSAVLNSALSRGASSSSQLQRFFGVTRLKIDPQLIGLDNTPQSRVSVEQPLSRDITVTYVQTLARAQGQLVRVQWDLSREWSALATRDENGVLSIDFVFRSSFK